MYLKTIGSERNRTRINSQMNKYYEWQMKILTHGRHYTRTIHFGLITKFTRDGDTRGRRDRDRDREQINERTIMRKRESWSRSQFVCRCACTDMKFILRFNEQKQILKLICIRHTQYRSEILNDIWQTKRHFFRSNDLLLFFEFQIFVSMKRNGRWNESPKNKIKSINNV